MRVAGVCRGHRGAVEVLAGSAEQLISGGEDGTVRFWNSRDKSCHAIVGFDDGISALKIVDTVSLWAASANFLYRLDTRFLSNKVVEDVKESAIEGFKLLHYPNK